MKTRFFVGIILASVLFVGCKNDKATQTVIEEPAIDEQFKITLDMIVKQDDDFQVYYKNGDAQFNEEQSVWVNVKGSGAPQQVVFRLPQGVVPDLIRIDLGMSNTQEDMTITGIHVDYLGKNFTTQGPDIANYFRPLEGTEIDFNTGVIKATLKDGKRIEPVLYPHEIPLGEKLVSIGK